MLTRYIQSAMRMALETCREELEEVLEEWVLFRVSRNLSLPIVDGIELVIKEVA
jgi:predicted RNase H-like HicB family nuclease